MSFKNGGEIKTFSDKKKIKRIHHQHTCSKTNVKGSANKQRNHIRGNFELQK